jgi:hypothetical protein
MNELSNRRQKGRRCGSEGCHDTVSPWMPLHVGYFFNPIIGEIFAINRIFIPTSRFLDKKLRPRAVGP